MKQKTDYTDDFLSVFKSIEVKIQEVYGSDHVFRDLEAMAESAGDLNYSRKLQLCRMIRNYASHNPDIHEFLPIPETTYNYLQSVYGILSNQTLKVKDKMSRIKPLTMKDNLIQGAKRLARLSEIPVVDSDGVVIGIFTNDVLRKCVSDELSMKSRFSKEEIKLQPLTGAKCVTQNEEMSEVANRLKEQNVLYVTDNGSALGKFIGVVSNE